jgi:membrane protein DedA with SNARE-associated domain
MIGVAFEGEIAILLAAGAASAGFVNVYAVFGACTFGNLVSDILWVQLGRYGKVDWFFTRLKWLGITPEKLEFLKGIISRDFVRLLVVAKITNWMSIPALVAIGFSRVPWKRWLGLIIVSDILIALVMVPLGYYMTSGFLQIEKGLNYLAIGTTLLLLIIGIYYARHLLGSKDRMAKFMESTQPVEGKSNANIDL